MNPIVDSQIIPSGSVLGINYSGQHDTAIAIVSPDGEPVFAVSLERISRKKQDGRLPTPLLEGLPWDRIAKVAISVSEKYTHPEDNCVSKIHPLQLEKPSEQIHLHPPEFLRVFDDIPCEKIFVPHHLSHAASSFWGAGYTDALCLVYDGSMSNESWFGGVYKASIDEGITPFDQFDKLRYANITSLYTAVTAVLGFTPLKHEGKITGLAAYGQSNSECRAIFEQWLIKPNLIDGLMQWHSTYDHLTAPSLSAYMPIRDSLFKQFASFSPEDMAATVQEMAESHVLDILENMQLQGLPKKNICLSGGLFANVKINQRGAEFGFENVFIAPAMTDDGTALGAAWQVASSFPSFRPRKQISTYLGPRVNKFDALNIIEKLGVKYSNSGECHKDIASMLASGKIVAICAGASEFGPRALGNRSILAPATNNDVNQTLNKRLSRTEFMPFAPIIRVEDADEYFNILKSEMDGCQFMTVTVDCSEKAQQDCPAVVHVDRTARPQLVTQETNPLVYLILGEYKKITGKLALVNTSFNIHEEPIVCSADDAFRGFFEAGLDCLYVEDIGIIERTDNREVQINFLRSKIESLSRSAAASLAAGTSRINELNLSSHHWFTVAQTQAQQINELNLSSHHWFTVAQTQAQQINELNLASHHWFTVTQAQAQQINELNLSSHHWFTVAQAQARQMEGLSQQLKNIYSSKTWQITSLLRRGVGNVMRMLGIKLPNARK